MRSALVVMVLFACVWLSAGVPAASAREYGSPPSGGGLVENPDGTWSFYWPGEVSPIATYSSGEHEVMRRLAKGLELDTGTTGQAAGEVTGLEPEEATADSTMTSVLRTGKPYASEVEEDVGDAVISEDEAANTLPTTAEVLAYAESVTAHPGPFLIIDGIGRGLEALEALPPVPEGGGEFKEPVPIHEDPDLREYYRHYVWYSPFVISPKERSVAQCGSFAQGANKIEMLRSFEENGFSLSDYCESASEEETSWATWESYACETSCRWVKEESKHATSPVTGWGAEAGARCPLTWVPCAFEEYGEDQVQGYLYIDDRLSSPAAFPAEHLSTYETASEPEADNISAKSRLSRPIEPAGVTVGSLEFVAFILAEECHSLLPDVEGHCPVLKAAGAPTTFGTASAAEPDRKGCFSGGPVNCATGNEIETQTDLSLGGRGPADHFVRTYNSGLALYQEEGRLGGPGPLGYGWTGSYSAHLVRTTWSATVYEDGGRAVVFVPQEGRWVPSEALNEAALAEEEGKWVYTLPNHERLDFNNSGQLTAEEDANGNVLTVAHNANGTVKSATNGTGAITFAYNSANQLESATDPLGHTVKYAYNSEDDLTTVTLPGETSPSWKYEYNGAHELTAITEARGNKTTFEYNEAGQVIAETDPLKHAREWSYTYNGSTIETRITEPNGSTTLEQFNEQDEPLSVTRAYGTSEASTNTFAYNTAGQSVAAFDPDGHVTTYTYNAAGDLTSETDALGDKTEWAYENHWLTSIKTPRGATTSIERNSHGDPTLVKRSAPGFETEETKNTYDSHGDLEKSENALGDVTEYKYNSAGDLTTEIDPAGDERTWTYDADSRELSTVSPRGHVKGAKESKFTTTIKRDAQERPESVTDPLKHVTQYTYEGGDLKTVTDFDGNTTTYEYNADNELIAVKQPTGLTTKTEYDAMGQVTAEIDGNEHKTEYVRNHLEEIVEVINPRGRKEVKEYDPAGNLIKLTDAANRTTTYSYDADNRLTHIAYSDGKTPDVSYEYDADGDRTTMTDGSGTTTYTYDLFDRLTEATNGHGSSVKYEYNRANEQTGIVYPGGETVKHTFDKAGRLETVTDWLEHTIHFDYSPDSQLSAIEYPSASDEEDAYGYNDGDQMTSVEMKKGSEVLASLTYKRDDDGQLKTATQTGLPGEESTSYKYDANNRLTKAGATAYEYDDANNPTKIGTTTQTFSTADELEKAGATRYSYAETGERTATTPEKGPTTTYGWSQAGQLTSVERPEGEGKAKIEDTYAYNGESLRTSETINGTTSYLTWAEAGELPLLLSNETYSFVYGPEGVPVEQINNSTGQVLYLHHDQAGSTRLITGESGKVEGKCSYSPYGTPTCEGSATTPLGYDAQYTSSDTGLVYLRNRVYDPTTAQFVSADPLDQWTHAPYAYATDNPLSYEDPNGLFPWGAIAEGLGVGASCLLGPEVCVPVGLGVLDAHVIAADIDSAETGCSPWPQIVPALVGAGVASLPFAGGVVAKHVWEASEWAYRGGVGAGLTAGGLAGIAASSSASSEGAPPSASSSCGCSTG